MGINLRQHIVREGEWVRIQSDQIPQRKSFSSQVDIKQNPNGQRIGLVD